ncbi:MULTISPECIES: hypothetical protein [unclassified Salinibacterium]|uniref:hypothetical protein n=1 Tax=unclassified Salinibacterium TaxID=2632331 RepID=UPI001423350A|nr:MULTISPECIES: hypothetical protein [unclassified Salinibacterium]
MNRSQLKTVALASGLLAVGGVALAVISVAGIVIAAVQGNALWIGLSIAGVVIGVLLRLAGQRLAARVINPPGSSEPRGAAADR